MKTNEHIRDSVDKVLTQVEGVSDSLHLRVVKINYQKESLSPEDVSDLRMYLGYTKNYGALAKTRLNYYKTIEGIADPGDE